MKSGHYQIRKILFPALNISLFKDNFYIVIETYHLPNDGQQENVHELDGKKLKQRQVKKIEN